MKHRAAQHSDLIFWNVQAIGWTLYGFGLMVPWFGEYPVSIMWPSKTVIAATGLLVTVVLREVHRWAALRNTPANLPRLVVIVVATSIVGGLVWERVAGALIGSSVTTDLQHLGVLRGGMPGLSGAAYHSLVLFAWTAIYLAVVNWRKQPGGVDVSSVTTGKMLVQEGKRSVLLDVTEIDWLEAAGDYVRLHVNGRRLLLRSTMQKLETRLEAHGHIRIHRSTIVNLDRVRELVRQRNNQCIVRLANGTTLRVSRNYSARLKEVVDSSVLG